MNNFGGSALSNNLQVLAASSSATNSGSVPAADTTVWRSSVDGALQFTDEPRVGGHALTRCGRVDSRLQRLGQPERDARRHAVVRGDRLYSRLLVDVDERRLLPGQADVDVSRRKLAVDLERRLRHEVEQA